MRARKAWPVQFSGHAARDYSQILSWTEENFGARQAHAYDALLRSALRKLAHEPFGGTSKARDEDIGPGYRSLHIGRRSRHLVLYRVERERILIVRILHDSMDLPQHLPE